MRRNTELMLTYFESKEDQMWTLAELREAIDQWGDEWRIPKSYSEKRVLQLLASEAGLIEFTIKFKRIQIRIYYRGEHSVYDLIQKHDQKYYYSHLSAIYLNNMTIQYPKNIYLKNEIFPRSTKESINLSQASIDRAFRGRPRVSSNRAVFQDHEICILFGEDSGGVGVIELYNNDRLIRTTDYERTLIDIAVRPFYSGGLATVIEAYREVMGKISANRILSYLDRLGYTYPYAQSIGFLMDIAGYPSSSLKLLNSKVTDYKMYLDYQIKDLEFNSKWNLFHPSKLNRLRS